MPTLETMLGVLHCNIEHTPSDQLRELCKIIVEVQAMSSLERDCIVCAFKHGPLFDGDVPSKAGRNSLVKSGYMSKVVVKGEDGYNACTYRGARAFRLIQAGA